MSEAGWTRDKEVEPAIDELKAQVQKIYNAGYQQGRVAGLREAACYCRNEADRSWSNDEIAGYDQALYETAMALDSLAQQAQEGGVGDGN